MRLEIQLKFHQDTLTEKFSFPVNVSSMSLKKVTTVVNFSSLQLGATRKLAEIILY